MSTIIHSLNLVMRGGIEPFASQVGSLLRIVKDSGIVNLSTGVVMASFSESGGLRSRVTHSNETVAIIGIRDNSDLEVSFENWDDLIKIFGNLGEAVLSRVNVVLGPPSSGLLEGIVSLQNEGEFVGYDRWSLVCDDFIVETETGDVLVGRFGLSLSGYCSNFAIINKEVVNAFRAHYLITQFERNLVNVAVRNVGGGSLFGTDLDNMISVGDWCWFWEKFE